MEERKKLMPELPVTEAEPEDYYDEEGLLCCGRCHTRKEAKMETPVISGTLVMDRYPQKCRCQQEQHDKAEAEKKLREHRQQVEKRKNICFVSPLMKNWCLEKADLSRMEHEDLVRLYADRWERMKESNLGYLFWGGVGNGKTYTAACIANALMEKEVSVLMRNTGYFLNAGFAEREKYLKDVRRYDLLILDDLGMERGTEYSLEMIFSIIDARYECAKPLIVTTNLSLHSFQNPEDLARQRIYDRILEMCVPVRFTGKSIRSEVARSKFETLARNMGGTDEG